MQTTGIEELRAEAQRNCRQAEQRVHEAAAIGNPRLRLQAQAELRMQLALLLRLQTSYRRITDVEDFKATVMQALADADPSLPGRVEERLARGGPGHRATKPQPTPARSIRYQPDYTSHDDELNGRFEQPEDVDGDCSGWQDAAESEAPRSWTEPGTVLLTASEAAAVLRITLRAVNHLGKAGHLPRVAINRRKFGYPREAVLAVAEERARASYRDKSSPDVLWWGPRDRPVDRVDLIPTSEAAAILGITRLAVCDLVRRGVLQGYQKQPYMGGSRIMVPAYYVHALAARPAYRKHRVECATTRPPETAVTRGWEEYEIEPVPLNGRRRGLERNHGEFYSTAQAAAVLGVSTASVRKLAARGRLRPVLHKRSIIQSWPRFGQLTSGNRWLFFRKEEVHALQNDPAYRQRRDADCLGRNPERKAARAAKQLEADIAAWAEARKRRVPLFDAWPSFTDHVPGVEYPKILR